jgi:hypothetical protein
LLLVLKVLLSSFTANFALVRYGLIVICPN